MVKSSKLIHLLAVGGLMLGSLGMAVGGPIGMNLPQAETSSAVKAASTVGDTTPLSITIHKYASNSSDGGADSGITAADGTGGNTIADSHTPLEGIEFKAQKVVANSGKNSDIDLKDPSSYSTDGTAQTLTTGGNGEVTFDEGTYATGKGVYLIHEVPSPGVTPVDDFLVQLPLQNAAKDGFITDVNVYPKNKTENVVMNPMKTLEKADGSTGATAPVELGANATWDLDLNVPKGAYQAADTTSGAEEAYARSLTLTDPIDSAHLKYVSTTGVYGTGKTELVDTTDYTATYDKATGKLTIDLTKSGLKKTAGQHVTFKVTTTVIAFADATSDGIADPIKNTFTADYAPYTGDSTSQVSTDYAATPEVDLGRLDITKVAESDGTTKLPDAEFHIATSQANAKSKTWVKYVDGMLKADGTAADQDADGNVILKTGANGEATINGLANGATYYFVETKAPAGYELSDQIYEQKVDADTDSDQTVKDQKDIVSDFLPITGGQLRIILMVVGTLLIIGSGTALYIKKRKENANLTD